jgi:dynein intermediate chain 1
MDDIQQREKIAKEKAKNTSSTGTKGHKDEDKSIFLPPADSHAEEVYYKNSELKKSILIMERMCNQNTFDDVSQDFKYWDAASDELGDKCI